MPIMPTKLTHSIPFPVLSCSPTVKANKACCSSFISTTAAWVSGAVIFSAAPLTLRGFGCTFLQGHIKIWDKTREREPVFLPPWISSEEPTAAPITTNTSALQQPSETGYFNPLSSYKTPELPIKENSKANPPRGPTLNPCWPYSSGK